MSSKIDACGKAGQGQSRRVAFPAIVALTAVTLVSACAVQSENAGLEDDGQTTEYFAESEYGVDASPRVARSDSGLRRGGGQYKLGNAYQVKGRWYRPKEDSDYQAVGAASWYGDAFHGRLTANGEVYDMNHLTAAHPTLPLPSYARVTNLNNDSSVIVRINDRGPFAAGRIIDLSKRAAEMLDYKHSGVAKVQVEYVGPAPLHGQDDRYLMASYQPGDPNDLPNGLPESVMVAMNSEDASEPAAAAANTFAALSPSGDATVALPRTGPVIPDRPQAAGVSPNELALLSYAKQQKTAASWMFDSVVNAGQTRATGGFAHESGRSYINLGVWSSPREMHQIQRALADVGSVAVERASGTDEVLYTLSLSPEKGVDIDQALRATWSAGVRDAFIVRD